MSFKLTIMTESIDQSVKRHCDHQNLLNSNKRYEKYSPFNHNINCMFMQQ